MYSAIMVGGREALRDRTVAVMVGRLGEREDRREGLGDKGIMVIL